jgi:hypothetical protein
MIFGIPDLTFKRIPVNMDVHRGHKNRDHQPGLIKKFGFVHLFNHHHGSVGSGQYVIFSVIDFPFGITKEKNGPRKQKKKTGKEQILKQRKNGHIPNA